jgi:PAS domain S-box-containing protein
METISLTELHAIIESSYDGIVITDKKGKILIANKAHERLTKIATEQVIGSYIQFWARKAGHSVSIVDLIHKHNAPATILEKKLFGKPLLITGCPVFCSKNEINKIVVNVRDTAELETLEQEAENAKKLAARYHDELINLKSLNKYFDDNIIANSTAMQKVFEMALRAAQVDSTVLILGESGVGKEVVAHFIHQNSERTNGPFVKINCGAIPENLLESELFGYEHGAFTGAKKEGKRGLFECATKGTLLLDEIGDIPFALQAKLLRVLQEKEVTPLGGVYPRKVDARIIAATNQYLEEMVAQGKFRMDLYFRLRVIPITIPPLRERKEDIIPLISWFKQKLCKNFKVKKDFSPQVINVLREYSWPGNVRELENIVEQLIVLSSKKVIGLDCLPDYLYVKAGTDADSCLVVNGLIPLGKAVQEIERQLLEMAMKKYQNTYKAAQALQISQPTVVRKVHKYNISYTRVYNK